MKILELCHFSVGICGVWQRVKQESELLSKLGHEVVVFSSNITKGTNEIASSEDKIGKVKIKRFPAKKLGGESFMKWNFEEEALRFKPDVIIAHSYRHPHTTKALRVAEEINCKVFLVTHAPFIEGNTTRSFLSKISVKFYDFFIASRTLNKFTKIIAITKWEINFLENLGVKREKIGYIPNGIPEKFFKRKKAREVNKILFLGRISPIKNLETLILAMSLIKENIFLEIVGPAEKDYLSNLKKLIEKKELKKRIKFYKPIYNLNEKINKIDSCKIFVLPSIREAMPQSLIEAMSREKIVISSDNIGARDIIKENENGFLFKRENPLDLAEKINFILKMDKSSTEKIKKEARKTVKKYKWSVLIKKLNNLLSDQ